VLCYGIGVLVAIYAAVEVNGQVRSVARSAFTPEGAVGAFGRVVLVVMIYGVGLFLVCR
jgi:Na+/alanine symporter